MRNVNHYMMNNLLWQFENNKGKVPETYIELPEGVDLMGKVKTITPEHPEIFFVEEDYE